MSYSNQLELEIQQGESKTLELKRELPKGQQTAKTLVAFANSSGGKLIIGVDDNREIVGVQEDIFQLQDKATSIIYDLCQPQLTAQIYIENINNKELLVIEVSRGNLLPYFLKSTGKEAGAYIRLGASNRQAGPEYIQQLELQRLNISFDELPNYQYKVADVDITPLARAFERAGKPITREKLLNLKMAAQEQGELYASNGLLILLGKYEHVTTQCARFKGTDMSVFLDRKEYEGDIFTQLEQTEIFIKNHLALRAEFKGLIRHDYLEIPEEAIREALINAYLHRDYSNFGRNIKVAVYDDMVNIVSAGGLPNGLSLNQMYQGRSEIRNRVLARVFKTLGYIEHWGSGIQRIKQMCANEGLQEPEFLETGDFFDVKLYRPEPQPTLDSMGGAIGGAIGGAMESLTDAQLSVLEVIRENPSLPYRKMAEKLGINPSAVQKHLEKLKGLGVIERIGGTRGYWQVNV